MLPVGRGWWLAVSVVAGLALVVGVDVIDNRWVRGRTYLAGQVRHRNLIAALVPAVAVGLAYSSGASAIVGSVLVGLAVIVVGSFMETFRLWKVTRWAGRQTVDQLRRVFELFGRALPLLMLFAVTLFINADVWQTAAVLGAARFWVVVAFFLVVGLVFLTLRLPGEVRSQLGDISAPEVLMACADSPLATCAADLADDVQPVELNRAQRVNVLLILMFAQLLQVVLVATMIAVFFFVFGLFAIQEGVINAWVGGEVPGGRVSSLLSFTAFGQDIVVTRELIRVAAFLGMLSGFYFTIYVITDKTYREDFFDTVLARGSPDRRGAVGISVARRRGCGAGGGATACLNHQSSRRSGRWLKLWSARLSRLTSVPSRTAVIVWPASVAAPAEWFSSGTPFRASGCGC